MPAAGDNAAAGEALKFGIAWSLSSVSGWGVYALNLTLQLLARGADPVLLLPPHQLSLEADQEARLAPLFKRQVHLADMLRSGQRQSLALDFPVLHALRNGIQPPLAEQSFIGAANAGMIFFEDTAIPAEGVANARGYDVIVTGSTWNAEVLQSLGLDNVVNVFQGIDEELFHPGDGEDLFPGRFVVFSGGKLEYRKGQDLVAAAFRRFQERHPEALLVFAWANQWPASVATIAASPLTPGAPQASDGGENDFAAWLNANGLPENSYFDLGRPANNRMPAILRNADVGLFPNRCEPGTNLVAMECMACGVPTILAANSGHLDLIAGETCYPLAEQADVAPPDFVGGTEGWGESSVDEIVATLEAVHADRAEAAKRGESGRLFMQNFTWQKQIGRLVHALAEHFPDEAP